MSKSKKKKAAAKCKKIEEKSRSTKSQVLQLGFDAPSTINPEIPDNVMEIDAHFYAYDENLLDRSRTQWQFGDWQSLAEIEQDTLQHHPDRAKLALLAAAGHLQLGNSTKARTYVRLAQDWGVGKKMISRILIAGVHNSLGRAVAAVGGMEGRALGHFEASVATGTPGGAVRLLSQARAGREVESLKGKSSYLPTSQYAIPHFCSKDSKSPRFIVINGMVRSGSTVAMKIVLDLLSEARLPSVKYYIDDFVDIKKIEDHILQNEDVCFVLKTHKLSDELKKIVSRFEGKYIYTKRELCEVAASLLRISQVKESPFYRVNGISLDEIMAVLKEQIKEYEKVKNITSCIIFSTEDFGKEKLFYTVKKISQFINIGSGMHDIESVVQKNFQEVNARFSKNINLEDATSLGHHKDNFFHKNHVVVGGTKISEYLSDEWREEIELLQIIGQ